MLTLSLPSGIWILAALAVLASGKMLQKSGIMYARGQDWHGITLLAGLLSCGVIGGIGFAIMVQNV